MPLRWVLAYVNAYVFPQIIKNRFTPLQSLKNIHRGERCFIVATGPSLQLSDLELIKNEVCFSCNSIVKLLNKTNWRPEYYFMYDKDVYKNIKSDITENQEYIKNFFHPYDWEYFHHNSRPYILKRDSWYSHKEKEFLRYFFNSKLQFSHDISKVVYRGGSVVHVMMQFAFFMGFKEIYLLGCDLNFLGPSIHAKGLSYDRPSSFSPERAKSGMLEDYELIKEIMKKRNINVYNSTRGGYLDVFERVNLEDIVKK